MTIFYNRYFQFSIFILIIYLAPFILLGENSYVRMHDNLDSMHVWFKLLAESGKIFSGSYEPISIFMNAPRVALENEINIQLWLYYFFDPYTALVINQITLRVVAYIGMFLFLKKYVFYDKFQEYNFLLSTLFAILPFWSPAGLTVSGVPFVVYAFLNIRANNFTKFDWIILFIYQIYSVFYHGGVFIIIFAGILWLHDIYHKKNIKYFTLSLFYFSIIGLLVNYRIIDSFFVSTDYISHRVEQVAVYNSFLDSLKLSWHHFIYGQIHTSSLHIVFLPFIFMMFIFSLISQYKNKLLVYLFLFTMFISIFYGFWSYEGWKDLKESYHFLIPLNLGRLYNVSPFIWYLLLAVSIKYYLDYYRYFNSKISYILRFKNIKSHIKINILLLLILSFILFNSDFIQGFARSFIWNYPTYKEFYSKNLFLEIENFIDKPKNKYRIVNLGFHPSVTQYNGFHTLDGYSSNYSLEYKHQFRKIIEKELNKDEPLTKYFDNWGNRCYLLTHEGNRILYPNKPKVINIDINSTQAYNMGARYIFSIHEIKNIKDNSLNLVKVFDNKRYFYKIYLYQIIMNK